ncbi:MAG: hypothetical protein JWN40_743 [Phycisphaerales bacterium]|nr:hypothetical protein [Phycisphaerales bacterium]
MSLTDRAPAQTNQGKGSHVEKLEDRLLLSGSLGRGDEGDRGRASTQVAVADFNGDGKADIASVSRIILGG